MLRILLVTILLLLSGSLAHAAVCTIEVGDLDFGAVDAIGNVDTATSADVSINCDGITPGTSFITVCGSIGAGSGGIADGAQQALGPDGSLGFGLYTTPGSGSPWGGTSGSVPGGPNKITVPVSDTSVQYLSHLYGIVPKGQQTAPVGEYRSDFTTSNLDFTYAEGELDCSSGAGSEAQVSFSVMANIAANCLLQTTDLDFGTAGIIGEEIDANADLSITCTPGTAYNISIDGGRSGDPAHRLLYSGANTISYGLYREAEHQTIWGTASGELVSGTGAGNAQHHNVYGSIPPQPAVAGAYADTVVVTITY